MLSLSNNQLAVQLLDPNDSADKPRFGTRYCSGGYIFQIVDARLGDLLSGPTFPASFNVFDGQGIPDAFNLTPLRSPEDGDAALIIGIGLCELRNNTVTEHAAWAVTRSADSIIFAVSQQHRDWRFDLTRHINLSGRTVRSSTSLHNNGHAPVPVRWFPHPFYPQMENGADNELIKLSIETHMPENPGYVLAPSGFISRRSWPWKDGFYQALDHAGTEKLIVQQKHPKLGLVTATCSYAPDFFPIWGNPRTFSWEPFLERTVAYGQTLDWSIDYDF